MNDNPNWVCENIRTLCGRPARLISSGMVTCFSTSSAARPGKRAMTLTWMSETSGNASIGSDAKATTPAPTNNTVNRRMNSGWPSAKATTRRITRSRASRQLEQPLHEQAARCYDALTAGQAVANRDDTVLLRPIDHHPQDRGIGDHEQRAEQLRIVREHLIRTDFLSRRDTALHDEPTKGRAEPELLIH